MQPVIVVPKDQALLPAQREKGRKTLVLDLDETLVHSSFQPTARYDIIFSVYSKKKS
jgi:TFIIF-interacting CTD phosphatase-like protein